MLLNLIRDVSEECAKPDSVSRDCACGKTSCKLRLVI